MRRWLALLSCYAFVFGLGACGPDDDPQRAHDTCYEWCAQQHAEGCGELDTEEDCRGVCDNYRSTMPEACFGEWRESLECQIDEHCSELLYIECLEEAVDATECIQDEREVAVP